VYHDITDRKRNERTLATLHDATREMMAAENPEAVARIASETAIHVLALPLNGIYFHEPGEGLVPAVLSPDARDFFGEEVVLEPGSGVTWQAFETGEPAIHEDVLALADVADPETPVRSELSLPLGNHGVMILASTEVGDFEDADVALARVLAANTETALDRTERETQLKRRNEQLDEFAGVISHNLRNPLGVAQGYLDLARETGADEDFERVCKAHDRMEAIIEDVLGLARQGKTVGETRLVALPSVVEHAWENVGTEAAKLTCEADADRPIEADEGRLEALLENLFRNAIEHGGESVTVRVERSATGFTVEDDGPGIPAAERDQVFEHGHTTSDSGTGFGLSIVEQIADAHGWEIAVAESGAGGARFEIRT
jgi:signal transduction histidine kinase